MYIAEWNGVTGSIRPKLIWQIYELYGVLLGPCHVRIQAVHDIIRHIKNNGDSNNSP